MRSEDETKKKEKERGGARQVGRCFKIHTRLGSAEQFSEYLQKIKL